MYPHLLSFTSLSTSMYQLQGSAEDPVTQGRKEGQRWLETASCKGISGVVPRTRRKDQNRVRKLKIAPYENSMIQ